MMKTAPDQSDAPDFSLEIPVSFGHCDPAGIVFYPNYYRWFDRCFHSFLQARLGGHAALCTRLGAVGLGLMDTGARFPAPATDGDVLSLDMRMSAPGTRSLRLSYTGHVRGTNVVEGFEVRGLFIRHEGRLRAGDLAPFFDMLKAG